MLNSLVNPLIYFSRRSEMRKFVFIKRKQLVTPLHRLVKPGSK